MSGSSAPVRACLGWRRPRGERAPGRRVLGCGRGGLCRPRGLSLTRWPLLASRPRPNQPSLPSRCCSGPHGGGFLGGLGEPGLRHPPRFCLLLLAVTSDSPGRGRRKRRAFSLPGPPRKRRWRLPRRKVRPCLRSPVGPGVSGNTQVDLMLLRKLARLFIQYSPRSLRPGKLSVFPEFFHCSNFFLFRVFYILFTPQVVTSRGAGILSVLYTSLSPGPDILHRHSGLWN